VKNVGEIGPQVIGKKISNRGLAHSLGDLDPIMKAELRRD